MVITARKKPVEIQAKQFNGQNFNEIVAFTASGLTQTARDFDGMTGTCVIPSLEGDKVANAGDWIIRGIEGEFYPCPDKTFRENNTHVSGNVYRKNASVKVTAVKFTGENFYDIAQFTDFYPERTAENFNESVCKIPHPGNVPYTCHKGDYVVKNGDSVYVCEGTIFEDTYEVLN